MCNPDFTGMELIHAKLIRKTTCSNGCRCDYTICGDQNPCAMEHPEYQDEQDSGKILEEGKITEKGKILKEKLWKINEKERPLFTGYPVRRGLSGSIFH